MSIKTSAIALARGMHSLLYPTLCLNCRRAINDEQTPQICLSCASSLSLTRYWELPENPVTDLMRGRLDIKFGAALYFFNTGTVCQSLIHALKYYHRPEVGIQLGEVLGRQLSQHPLLSDLHGIIPVPIHPQRRHTRGYNQAEKIAEGLAHSLQVPSFPQALKRTSFKGSQTKKNRYERIENVAEVFAPGKGDFVGKHLLLVDDVITTGATLDFCGNLLLQNHEGCKLSLATLAMTEG